MEKIILIQAKTNKGKKALEQDYRESKQIGLQHKLLFKASGYKKQQIGFNPVVIKFTINNKIIEKPLFLQLIMDEIIEAYKLNGAQNIKDYFITEK